jgi:hypothetical protein
MHPDAYRALSRISGSNDRAQPTQISIEMHPNTRRSIKIGIAQPGAILKM